MIRIAPICCYHYQMALFMWSISLLAMRQISRTTLNRKKPNIARELVKQLDENFNEVNFVNLSMSSLGIFAQECSTFLEMLGNVGLDKNYRTYWQNDDYCHSKYLLHFLLSKQGLFEIFDCLVYLYIFMYSVLSFLLVHSCDSNSQLYISYLKILINNS